MTEPQSVIELMAQTRSLWGRQSEVCDDDSREARRDLYGQLTTLEDEYSEANYTRREDIEKAFRDLMAQHRTLPVLDVSVAEVEAPSAPVDDVADAAADTVADGSADTVAEATPDTADSVHRSPSFSDAERGDTGPTPSRGGATGGVGRWAAGWYQWAYHEVDYQVLCRNREKRLSELGGRLHDLQLAGRMDEVTSDEGIARLISQVDEVDVAITANRAAKKAPSAAEA